MAVSTRDLHDLLRQAASSLPLGRARTNVTPFRGRRVRTPELELEHLSVTLDGALGVLFARMKHTQRACYTQTLMQDMKTLQNHLVELYAGLGAEEIPFRYLAWCSDAPRAWSLGGDLCTFTNMIR
ncbi:MAG TPA: hypothetical protein VNS22_12795, partial [Geminicoccus sp.]|uniref:hypothetical protein n=1 Tax=Geminicoccus sp. TaxID=2024832 RepID=UPI002C59A385